MSCLYKISRRGSRSHLLSCSGPHHFLCVHHSWRVRVRLCIKHLFRFSACTRIKYTYILERWSTLCVSIKPHARAQSFPPGGTPSSAANTRSVHGERTFYYTDGSIVQYENGSLRKAHKDRHKNENTRSPFQSIFVLTTFYYTYMKLACWRCFFCCIGNLAILLVNRYGNFKKNVGLDIEP